MTTIASHPIESLLSGVPLSYAGEPGYTAAATIWAQPIGRNPVVVAHCRTAVDVQEAVRAARKLGMPLSVRGGGHDWAGRSLCSGLVIDLAPTRSAVVEGSTVLMGGGTLARDLFDVADPIGCAAVTGSTGAVGMGGLTLGGGYGPLIGRFGLVLDNLLWAEVVLADGSIVTADERTNTELFWAMRGGGGNFGVVTRMRHRLHSLSSVHSGIIFYPLEQAEKVLDGYADLATTAPDELTVQYGFISSASGEPLLFLAPTWAGDADDGERRVAPLARLGAPRLAVLNTHAPGAANTLFDDYIVNGQRVVIETRLLRRLSSENIGVLIAAIARRASPGCSIVTHEFRGAAARVPLDSTAFGIRDEHVLVEIIATSAPDRRGEPSADAAAHHAWVKDTANALDRYSFPGAYANMLTDEDPARVRASFGRNARRLALAKRQFDPDDVFRSSIPVPRDRGGAPEI
jgi:FAD/FMN-containing dehydrogenase